MSGGGNDTKDVENEIMRLHEKFGHRKTITNILRDNNINIPFEKLNYILNKCETCLMKDKQYVKNSNYVRTSKPREMVAFDLMEVDRGKHIIVGIDYFCRFRFSMSIGSKKASEVLKFIKNVFSIFKFEKMIVDNGCEFQNKYLKEWARNNNDELFYSIPYNHQSNGRVERFNRTIRDGLKRMKRPLCVKLKQIIKNYNENMIRRATGLTPQQTLLEENKEKILSRTENYEKEFKSRKLR
ncbi:Pro-Pol polyprotein [Dictyocoela muelleri]|nr:Pro-Pol polyprotein [Dictyocoela muelleri]